ncbi:MAG: T9SS type A sorting domain-containing protein [Bacteroidales bacterium]|nr:T9SS type A sorting domain-containing protein [Bacteroidales bacterium]
MKRRILIPLFFLSLFAQGQTIIPGGSVNGSWQLVGSPYLIQGSIFIQDGETLSIEPGVSVEFEGTYKLLVLGQLLAVGNNFDTISFSAADTLSGWLGIHFDETPETNDTSRISYCKIKYVNTSTYEYSGAIFLDNFSKLVISNCLISNNKNSHNGGGINCYSFSSPIIRDNRICYNEADKGAGICSSTQCDPKILNNIIEYNIAIWGGGIYLGSGDPLVKSNIIAFNESTSNGNGGAGGVNIDWFCDPILSNNLICYNIASGYGAAISCDNGDPILANNTITGNSSGIHCDGDAHPVFYNTILYGNSDVEVYIETEDSDPDFYYCNVQGGTASFVMNGNLYTGTYESNIDNDPQFVDAAGFDFHVDAGSPVIDGGLNFYVLDSLVLDHLPRIVDGDGDGTADVDMGAYEYQETPMLTSFFIGEDTVCQTDNGIFIYTGNATPDATFFWDFDGGEIISGSGQGPYHIHWEETGSKTISLYVYDNEIYSDTSYHITEVVEATDVSLTIVSTGNIICEGESVTFTALPVNGGEYPVYEWNHNGQIVGANSQVYTTSDIQDGDTVYCRMNSSLTCVSVEWAISNMIDMFVYEYPLVSIEVLPNDTVDIEEIITLNAGVGADSYLWSTGETTQSIEVSNTSGPTGGMQEYSLVATNENLCAGYDTVNVYFTILTDINKPFNVSKEYIYPNPTSGNVYLQLSNDAENVTASIVTVQGRLIHTVKIDKVYRSTPVEIEFPNMPSGIYLLHITSDGYRTNCKIFIK